MIRCIIVDDELHAINVLKVFIDQTAGVELVGSFFDPLAALEAFKKNGDLCDVIFLDIDMEHISGIQFAEMVKGQVKIVFSTAHETFALKAFDNNAIDFLLKPISYERFLIAIGKLGSSLKDRSNSDVIFIQADGGSKIYRILKDEIQFIESHQHYIKIHLAKDSHLVRMNISDVENALSSPNFLRIHKSFIVNVNQIKSIYGNRLTVNNECVLSIGKTFMGSLFQLINGRMFGNRQ